jgi:hypothetical protein
MARISIMLMLLVSSCQLFATQPSHNYSDKFVSELLGLLENTNAGIRADAAIFLGDRYRDPKDILPNSPIHKTNSPPPELPVPKAVFSKLSEHLNSDKDSGVQVSVIDALGNLRFRANTTPFIIPALTNHDSGIRIRGCLVLTEISHKYSEKLPDSVIPTLKQCLSETNVETLWYAAWAAEQLGKDGKPLMPILQSLKNHPSSKVRYNVERAITKISSAK